MSVQSVRLRASRGSHLQKPRPLKSTSERTKIENIMKGVSSSLCSDVLNEEMEIRHNISIVKNCTGSESDTSENLVTYNFVQCSGVTEENNNNLYQNSTSNNMCKARRAPRAVKLDKPRPLKGTKTTTSSEATEFDTDIKSAIEKLNSRTLSSQDTSQLCKLLSDHGSEIEKKNKDLMVKLFDCIQESLTNNDLDKLLRIHLVDLVALRNRNWEPSSPVSPRETKRVSWKDIADSAVEDMDDSSRSDGVIASIHHYETQQSLDSGFGEIEDDEVLWEDEDSYLKELETELLLEEIKTSSPIAENQDLASSKIIEPLEGIQISGQDEKTIKKVIEVLKQHMSEITSKKQDDDITTSETTDKSLQESTERPRFSRQQSWTKMVIREPLGPGSGPDIKSAVEKTMPSGRFTAKGRRAMFAKFAQLMHDQERPDNEEPIPYYSRDELLRFSESPLTKSAPDGWSYLTKIYPNICLSEITVSFSKTEFLDKREQTYVDKYIRPCRNSEEYGNKENEQNRQRRFSSGFASPFKVNQDGHSDNCDEPHDKNLLMRRHSYSAGILEKNDTEMRHVGGFGTPEKRHLQDDTADTRKDVSSGFGTPCSGTGRNSIEQDNFSSGFGTSENSEGKRNKTRRNSGGLGTPNKSNGEQNITRRNSVGFGTPNKSNSEQNITRRNSGGFGTPNKINS